MVRIIFIITFQILSTAVLLANPIIPLSGTWSVKLDPNDVGIDEKWFQQRLPDQILLPGTLAQAGLGEKTTGSRYGILTPEYDYIGAAWYQRKIIIPEAWKGKEVELFLERVLWESRVFIGDEEISVQDALGTPHLHKLGQLSPGEHTLSIRVDNDMIYNIGDKGHGYGEYMQSIWNGIVGEINLTAHDPIHIGVVRVFSNIKNNTVEAEINVSGVDNQSGRLLIELVDADGKSVMRKHVDVDSDKTSITMAPDTPLEQWSEYNPVRYTLFIQSTFGNNQDVKEIKFGFSEVSSNRTHILINDQPVFLRGNLDCVHFPLTGYPTMTVEEWRNIFQTYKDYGLNHVRFHSWCPPKAAFEAADELGIYIQAEASIWIDWWMGEDMVARGRPEMNTKGYPQGLGRGDEVADEFVRQEMQRVIDWYGNHPSFVLFCIGNELGSSDFDVIGEWIHDLKTGDPRQLYAASTARTVTPYCDYSATHNFPDIGLVRGRMNSHNNWDYEDVYSQAPVPIIAHEIGQWPVYPLWQENEKYTGVLKARNLEELEELAKAKGLHHQDAEFREASGKLSALLYKDEIESFLRTPSCGGFQLLSMQDYIGQGEALIGWLDSFYDSKGIISPKDFRKFNNEVVPLVKLESYTWRAGDTIRFPVLLHQYASGAINHAITWSLSDPSGNLVAEGRLTENTYERGRLHQLETVETVLPESLDATRLTLRVVLENSDYKNSWPIWVFPKEKQTAYPAHIHIAERFDAEAQQILDGGGSVLLMAHRLGLPSNQKYANWRPLYWSASFFPGQNIETIGLLIQDDHPLFAHFPTEGHSNWQWRDLSHGARGFLLNHTPEHYQPIAQPVSDFHYSEKLGTIFEFRVGSGKLLVCGYDITEERGLIEADQLRYSMLNYMTSDQFRPTVSMDVDQLESMFFDFEPARTEAPTGFEDAILYVEAHAKASGLSTYHPSADRLVVGDSNQYSIDNANLWKDTKGVAWVGDAISMTINVPNGFLGDLYVYFHDWSNQNREGLITLEGRQYRLGDHSGEGQWIKLHVMREDTQDGQIIFNAEKAAGPNLMFTKFALVQQ